MAMKIHPFVLMILGSGVLTAMAQTPQPSPSTTSDETSLSLQSKPNAQMELIDGRVIRVVDGDSITVQSKGQIVYAVKLQAIDAPDVGQPFFEEARKSLSKLILNKDVRVVINTTYGKDMIIGSLYRNGQDIGLTLIEQGLAWHFKRFAFQQNASARKSYSDAQSSASAARIGLWADEKPVAPWDFRGESTILPSKNERKYLVGPKGGCYYVSESGRKVYVQDKTLCGLSPPLTKP
ncbi:MAG: thermonuclease family protein [Pyrinomonadaceae bacterium]